MRGLIMRRGYQRAARPRLGRRQRSPRTIASRARSTASSRRSLTTTWANSSWAASSASAVRSRALDLLGVVGAAADEARAQRLERRRRDEDLHRLGHRRRGPGARPGPRSRARPGAPARGPALELGAQRPVAAARVRRRARRTRRPATRALELRVGEEVVVDAVLARPAAAPRVVADTLSSSSGMRSRSAADQRALADARTGP